LLLIAYAAPALPAAMLSLPLILYLPPIYSIDAGLDLAIVGIVIGMARLWDLAIDLPIGWASDRARTRWGRRKPFLILALPVAMVGSWFVLQPPAGAGAFYLGASLFVVYLGWSMLQIPHLAWGAELADTYHGRNRVMAAREIATTVGLVVAMSVPAIVACAEVVGPSAASSMGIPTLLAITLAALPLAGLLLLAAVPDRAAAPAASPGWRAGFALMRANQPFRRLIVAYTVNGVANALPAALFFMYVRSALNLQASFGDFLLAYFGAGILAVPLWLRLARRYGKHGAWCRAMLLACVAFAFVPALGPGAYWPFMAICVLTGIAFGADLALPASMMADAVDVDTAAGGAPRTGLYFACWTVATKLAMAVAPAAGFPLLQELGFSMTGPNGPTALFALAALYAWAPVACKLAAIALMWNFTLTETAQAELRRRIAGQSAHVPSKGVS
jgi:Na+/melibiose symporter-like transporter